MDDYLSDLGMPERAAFEQIRKLAMDVVPDAEEGTSYGMAALKYKQQLLMAVAWSDQLATHDTPRQPVPPSHETATPGRR